MDKKIRCASYHGAEVAVVVAFRGARFLLVDTGRGWEFPGGRINAGEDALEAARRELLEESGAYSRRMKYVGRGTQKPRCAVFTCELDQVPPAGRLFSRIPNRLAFDREEMRAFLGAAWRSRNDYDRIAPYFDTVRGASAEAAWLNQLIALLGGVRGQLIADVGCGTGRYAVSLAASGATIVGLDMSLGMLNMARTKPGSELVSWVLGDAQKLPLSNSGFDGAIMFLVIQHLADWTCAVSECVRILRPGGKLVLVTTSQERIKKHLIRFFPGAAEIDLGRFPPVRDVLWTMRNEGLHPDRAQRVLVSRGPVSIERVVERFRAKQISTLELIPPDEFEKGTEAFEAALKREFGSVVQDDVELTFITATKPSTSRRV